MPKAIIGVDYHRLKKMAVFDLIVPLAIADWE